MSPFGVGRGRTERGPAGPLAALQLSWHQLASLASGYGDADALGILRAGQVSKRCLLILAVGEAADSMQLRTAASLDEALAVIFAAERRAPDVVTSPHVDAWATRCLRRMRSPGSDPAAALADLGYLSALAAAAAARAGTDFEIRVPTTSGVVYLPTLGTAIDVGRGLVAVRSVPGGIEVVGASGAVTVPAPYEDSAVDWHPLRNLSVDLAGHALRLTVDDGDPYRDCYQRCLAGRLTDAEVAELGVLLADAWSWIVRHLPGYTLSIRTTLRSIVPLTPPRTGRNVSATSRVACGSLAMSVPTDAETLALSLIHEVQHMKLGALLDLVDLYRYNGEARHRAPWRLDPRPVGALLQGAYAHLGVADFWRARRRDGSTGEQLAQFDFAYWQQQTSQAVETLLRCGDLTLLGERFVGRMADALRSWHGETVSPEIGDAVRDVVDANAFTWSFRNLQHHAEDVSGLVRSWQAGAECSGLPPPMLGGVTTPIPAEIEGLASQIRHNATNAAPLTNPAPLATIDLTAADRAYIVGEFGGAVDGYREQIYREPTSEQAWSGLALALRRQGRASAARALVTRPDLVCAMYLRLRTAHPRRASPDELATWIGACLPAIR